MKSARPSLRRRRPVIEEEVIPMKQFMQIAMLTAVLGVGLLAISRGIDAGACALWFSVNGYVAPSCR